MREFLSTVNAGHVRLLLAVVMVVALVVGFFMSLVDADVFVPIAAVAVTYWFRDQEAVDQREEDARLRDR